MTLTALTGCRLFDGEVMQSGKAVLMDGPAISDVVDASSIPAGADVITCGGGVLAPGFIDIQVNGGGGALFNAAPGLATLQTIASAHRRFGTTGMLPTVITDAQEVLSEALGAVREARKQAMPGILGIHVEGPFLDLARKGAHDESYIREISPADVDLLAGAGCGSLLLTVAPNRVPPSMITALVESGIVVSLGHSDATFETAMAALHAGATSFTHLYNAMSQLGGREPGMVGAALSHDKSYVGIIADGHHVHPAALRLALQAKRRDRFILVSDAMPTAAGGGDGFELQGRHVRLRQGRLQLADGTLAGSNLTMIEAVRYAVESLQVKLEEALAMASLNPAALLGLGTHYGRVAPGFRASLVHFDDAWNVSRTWIDGR